MYQWRCKSWSLRQLVQPLFSWFSRLPMTVSAWQAWRSLRLYLDGKTGLLTGLIGGKQGWKFPVDLLATCCGSKSLKVILIDSDFRAHPVLNPLVTLYLTPSSRKDFFEGKNFFSHESINRASRTPKMGDGGVFHTPCVDFSRPVEELDYTCLLKSNFTETSHDRGFKTCQTLTTYPECVFCGKMYRWGEAYVVTWTPTFRKQQLVRKGCRSVCRITNNITCPE
jgi:hypothetical protein